MAHELSEVRRIRDDQLRNIALRMSALGHATDRCPTTVNGHHVDQRCDELLDDREPLLFDVNLVRLRGQRRVALIECNDLLGLIVYEL